MTRARELAAWRTTRNTVVVATALLILATVRWFVAADPCRDPDDPFSYCIERRYLFVLAAAVALVSISLGALFDWRRTRSDGLLSRLLALLPPVVLALVGGWLVLV